jgi:hypothetical protein
MAVQALLDGEAEAFLQRRATSHGVNQPASFGQAVSMLRAATRGR